MFKNLLLSFSGIGGIAIIPFSLLFSKGEGVSLYSGKDLLVDSTKETYAGLVSRSPTEVMRAIDISPVVTRGGHLREQSFSGNARSSVSFQAQRANVSNNPASNESLQLSHTPEFFVTQVPTTGAGDTDFNHWLSTISPLLKGEGIKNPLTIISRWNKKYFVILKWDPSCQCFRRIDNDYGIWSSSDGLFIVAHKSANEQTKREWTIDKPQCKNFNSFWYQDWHTHWRLKNWLKSFDTDKTSNTAVASCYKEPVIFLNTNIMIPLFEPITKGVIPKNMEKGISKEIAWDYNTRSFTSSYNNFGGSSNIVKLSNYEDWKKFFNLVEAERK